MRDRERRRTDWEFAPKEIYRSETCLDCGETFTITESQAEWFARRGLQTPRRCEECRAKRKAAREGRLPLEDGGAVSRPPAR